MAEQSTNWATTFFWEQDLRSLYMNGLLNSVLKPGVYNGNMGVFACVGLAENPSMVNPGIYLYIKRGTTFVFSNNFKYDKTDSRIVQDLETTGKFIIKSVALNDMVIPIITLSTGEAGSALAYLKAFFGGSDCLPAPEIYITASIQFTGEGALEAGSAYDSFPTFSWMINKSPAYINCSDLDELNQGLTKFQPFSYMNKLVSNTTNYTTWGKGFYFLDAGTLDGNGRYYAHQFPADGNLDTDSSTSNPVSGPYNALKASVYDRMNYLIIGRCVRAKKTSLVSYLGTNGTWAANGPAYWNQDYTFTAAGLPAYRLEQSVEYSGLRPSILPIINHAEALEAESTPYFKYGCKFELKNLLIDNYSWSSKDQNSFLQSMVLSSHATGSILNLADFSSDSKITSAAANEKVILLDFFYILFREKINRANGVSLTDFFKTTSGLESSTVKRFSFLLRKSDVSPDADWLLWKQVVTDLISFNMGTTPTFDSSNINAGSLPAGIIYNTSSVTGQSGPTTIEQSLGQALRILDLSPINLARQKEILNSSNFVNTITEYFRQVAPENLRFSSSDDKAATTLVPLALVFRGLEKGNAADAGFTSSDQYATLDGQCNPANVLDFFSLQTTGSKMYSVPIQDGEVYTLLPVIN